MKATIEVVSRDEADNIRAGLGNEHVRAFVTMMGVLMRLPDDRSRTRVLNFVTEHLSDSGAVGASND